MKIIESDIAVIGGGAAGLSAGAFCAANGRKTIVIERNSKPGGVLLQCIHSGFGLHYFKEELTGPEYAARLLRKAENSGAEILTDASVTAVRQLDNKHILTIYSPIKGVFEIYAKAVILAMGCRERCRGNLGIPGERCVGIYNAGFAQQLINISGYLPGREAVIVGSGDIGLIMARRLSWSGVKVKCVVEIMPYPAGLSRNITQCLEDFNIPLHLNHTVSEICGKDRVEGIKIAPLVNGRADMSKERFIKCDTILFSVGLVPANEIVRQCRVELDPITKGAKVDGNYMTSVKGIFSCGNVLHVHDLVDFVSIEAERAAENACKMLDGKMICSAETAVKASDGVRYVVPSKFFSTEGGKFFLRAAKVADRGELIVKSAENELVLSKKLCYIKPAEMISFEIPGVFSDLVTVEIKEL